jgi:hypothetical protein
VAQCVDHGIVPGEDTDRLAQRDPSIGVRARPPSEAGVPSAAS